MAIADSLAMDDGTYGSWDDRDSWASGGGWLGPRLRRKSYNIVCKQCGTGGLHWVETDEGWRLFTNGEERHKCQFGFKSVIGRKDPYQTYLDSIPWTDSPFSS